MQSHLRHSASLGVTRAPGIGSSQSWGAYWTQQSEVLFLGQYKNITGGRLYNEVKGSSDYLTVSGSAGSETYQCPQVAAYRNADTDFLWAGTDGSTWNTVTTTNLIGSDFTRTIVKYLGVAPNSISAIMILSSTITPGSAKENKMRSDFLLSLFWSGTSSIYGETKGNRAGEQAVWLPYPIAPSALGLTVISQSTINGSFTDNSGGYDTFEVWRSTTDETNYTLLQSLAKTVTTFSDNTGVGSTTYYYKVRGTDGTKASVFCTSQNATTLSPIVVPTVTTTTATNVKRTTASTGGNVTDNGGGTVTARGVCYGAGHNPDTSGSYTSDGTGIGSFASSLTGLTPGATYYIRAYATNSVGVGYGSEISITTSAYYFHDSFTGTDGTDLANHTPDYSEAGTGWAASLNTFKLASGKVSTAVAADCLVDSTVGDGTFQVNVSITSAGIFGSGLLYRCADTAHGFLAHIHKDTSGGTPQLTLLENTGTSWVTSVADVALTKETVTGTLQVVASGNNITIYWKGVLKITFSSPDYKTSTKCGIHTYIGGSYVDTLKDELIVQ